MQFFRIALCACLGFLMFAATRAEGAAERFSLDAQSIQFYGDRFLLEADGGVRVVLDDKYTITGNTFSMDARLNRFVVAGNVHVVGPDIEQSGAGFADFIDQRRVYFVPVLDQPDRWTYENLDFAHPFKGREMPGDPFFLPDVSRSRVTVSGQHVDVQPLGFMRFKNARLLSLGVYVPLPTYVLNFSQSPEFRQNSLAGAIFDAPYDFAGGPHTLSTLHFRYDQTNRAFASFEQHYVAPGGYVVASLNPLNRENKQLNVIGLGRIGPRDQAYMFAQEFTDQRALSMPIQASAAINLALTHTLRQSFLQLSIQQNYQSLLAQPSTQVPGSYYYYQDPGHAWVPDHPVNATLTWQGFDHQLGKLPVVFRARSSFFMAHNAPHANYSYGIMQFEGQNITDLYFHTVGLTLYTRSIKLPHNTFLNLSYDRQRQWFSLPHYIDSSSFNGTFSRTFGTKLATFAGYSVNNVGDYWGAKQTEIYPPSVYTSPFNGLTYYGFAAFRGIATYRSLYASAVFAPNPNAVFNVMFRSSKDFPEPIPLVLGNPPSQLIGDFRVRISPHAMLDVQRMYNFNWAGQPWSPNFQVQVLPQ